MRGGSRLAARLGVPPLIIGLTVVALGTSAPEVAVSVGAAVRGSPDVAVGNVVGSNILNVLLILGLGAVLVPLAVSQRLVRREVPFLVAASVLVWLMSRDGVIGRAEATFLLVGFVAYIAFLAAGARRVRSAPDGPEAGAGGGEAGPDPAAARFRLLPIGLSVAASVLLLLLGARWLVESGMAIARSLGVSELVIGLTAIALGTSLPELAATLSAAARRQADLVVGNAIGSNIANLLVVLGAAGVAAPGGLAVSSAARSFDLPLMILVAVACLPIFFTGHRISRWEGIFFLGYYAAYVCFLALDATGHEAVPIVRGMLLLYAGPLTLVTAVVLAVRAWQRRRARGEGGP